jgi:predicted O-methyltransferase YrrM
MLDKSRPSTYDYERAFALERAIEYPAVDKLEARLGFKVDREMLENAARVLACPVKVNTPCWQHGRVVYAAARWYLQSRPKAENVAMLDIGTAKGFSALCVRWAADHSRRRADVTSVDVIDPEARQRRNTVAEVGGMLTLAETLAPWPEAHRIQFVRSTGVDWLMRYQGRVHFAFIDGKHSYDAVSLEIGLLRTRQQAGDVTVLDDLQIPGVARAVEKMVGYDVEIVVAKPDRQYAIAVRN